MKNLIYWGIGLCLLLSASAFGQSLEAEVDRDTVSIDETLTLTVRFVGGQAGGNFELGELSQDFDVMGSQKSMQHSIVNGQVEAFTQWTFSIAPKQTGSALIPAFDLNGYRSEPIEVTVKPPAPAPAGSREDVFIETVVDKNEVFVQEQFVVTYRLYMNRNVDNLDRPELTIDGARVEELPRVEYRRTLDGVTYEVVEFKFAVFADTSGSLAIPSELWTVRTQDGAPLNRFALGGGRFKLFRIRTDAVKVEVAPKPDSYPAAATWLPASDLQLAETWSKSPEDFTFGEPITRTVTITAEGLSSEQLPPIPTPTASDFKFYPDQPVQDNRLQASGVTGVRVESSAIVPSRGGELVLPEVKLVWWDVETDSLREATLPERTIHVAGPVAPVAAPTVATAPATEIPASDAPPATDTSSMWPWLTIITSLLALCFAVLWWRARRAVSTASAAEPNTPRPRAALRDVSASASARDLPALRRALLAFARAAELPARTLSELAALAPAELADALRQLDAALYGRGDSAKVPVEIIAGRIAELDNAAAPARTLAPLYAS